MTESTIADLEQRYKDADAAYLALLDEQTVLSDAQLAFFPRLHAGAVAATEARAAWETARRGGPLEPGEVLETLRREGAWEPEQFTALFLVERAAALAPLPYAIWIRPRTREGHQWPWVAVREPLLEAGYVVRKAHEKRYRLKGEQATGWYSVMVVERAVLEEHRTVADDDAAWQEEVEMMARASER